jgi:hypothetical protein
LLGLLQGLQSAHGALPIPAQLVADGHEQARDPTRRLGRGHGLHSGAAGPLGGCRA